MSEEQIFKELTKICGLRRLSNDPKILEEYSKESTQICSMAKKSKTTSRNFKIG